MSRTTGLTLHWLAGVGVHDPTSNFKLYSHRFRLRAWLLHYLRCFARAFAGRLRRARSYRSA